MFIENILNSECQINKVKDILSKYDVERNINLDEKFEEVLKKGFIEFEENNDLKNILNLFIIGNHIISRDMGGTLVAAGTFVPAVVGFAASALTGRWGWIIGALVGVVFSLSNYTRMWKRHD